MAGQHAEGTFEVTGFTPVELGEGFAIATAMQSGVATLQKRLIGQVEGRSSTIFAGGQGASGTGSYVAYEAFEGSLNGVAGAFNFVHAASTHGEDRYDEFFTVVAASGTDGLAGITGGGGLAIDADGTHRIWFDYDLG